MLIVGTREFRVCAVCRSRATTNMLQLANDNPFPLQPSPSQSSSSSYLSVRLSVDSGSIELRAAVLALPWGTTTIKTSY